MSAFLPGFCFCCVWPRVLGHGAAGKARTRCRGVSGCRFARCLSVSAGQWCAATHGGERCSPPALNRGCWPQWPSPDLREPGHFPTEHSFPRNGESVRTTRISGGGRQEGRAWRTNSGKETPVQKHLDGSTRNQRPTHDAAGSQGAALRGAFQFPRESDALRRAGVVSVVASPTPRL